MIKPELFQKIISSSVAQGDIIPLKTTFDKHWHGLKQKPISDSASTHFADVLNQAFTVVNDQQVHSEKQVQKMISDPRSVNVHDVLIASEKARMSLTFTKTITDLAVRTYRDLINLR